MYNPPLARPTALPRPHTPSRKTLQQLYWCRRAWRLGGETAAAAAAQKRAFSLSLSRSRASSAFIFKHASTHGKHHHARVYDSENPHTSVRKISQQAVRRNGTLPAQARQNIAKMENVLSVLCSRNSRNTSCIAACCFFASIRALTHAQKKDA